ncbi:MAG: hypothetical protein DDG60_00775 [Anaerolineae bacterium]|nr:MAG: hypothetical protein DDG60_00775 [Anaerolineae bacterium]
MDNLDEKQTEREWVSHSNRDAVTLSSLVSRTLFENGVENHLSGGWGPVELYIQALGFNIRFTEKEYGCDARVFVFENNSGTAKLEALWQKLVNRGVVWGGPFKKQAPQLPAGSPADTPKGDNKKSAEVQKWEKIAEDLGVPDEDWHRLAVGLYVSRTDLTCQDIAKMLNREGVANVSGAQVENVISEYRQGSKGRKKVNIPYRKAGKHKRQNRDKRS